MVSREHFGTFLNVVGEDGTRCDSKESGKCENITEVNRTVLALCSPMLLLLLLVISLVDHVVT